LGRPPAAVGTDIAGILKLQAVTLNPDAVALEEAPDVVPVDGLPSVISEGPAHRMNSAGEEQAPAGDSKSSPEDACETADA
jgi:hypothetical protein